MSPSMRNLFNCYFILCTCSFCHVFSISPCDLKAVPQKSKREEIPADEMSRSLLQETGFTTVDVSFSINDLNLLDIKRLDLEIDLEMTEKWCDPRLAPDYKTRKLAVRGAIWQPKIAFVVGNKVCPDVLSDQTQFWRATSNGSVLYSERFLIKPKCTTDLTKYPFDSQTCFIKIGSYRHSAEEVRLAWSSARPVELRVEKELGEFRLKKFKTYDEIENRSAGNFSVLVLEIQMTRYCLREILQSFTPSFIFVKIAYGVLWTKVSDIRTRILTCQFSLFGILFLFTNSNYGGDVSNVTHLKALDIWYLMCFVFVLLPLAESIIVLLYFDKKVNTVDGVICDAEIECDEKESAANKWATWMEKVSRILHPILLLSSTTLFFAVFNDDD